MNILANALDWLGDWLGLAPDVAGSLLETLIILVLVLLVRAVSLRMLARKVEDVRQAYYWRRGISYTATIVAVLLVGRVWFSGLRNIGTFLGLLSAGVAIALADVLANLAGWIFLLARRPYEVGDRIEIDNKTGDVIDIRLFNTYLMECGNWVEADQSTGRILLVPNGRVFKTNVANYTQGFQFIWDELRVLVTFESDWKRAKEILTAIANDHGQPLSRDAQEQIRRAAGKHMIVFQNLTPIVYTEVRDCGVLLTIRYLTPPRQRRGNAAQAWEDILEAFALEPTIDFAYPTQRAYVNMWEGKPEAKAGGRLQIDGRLVSADGSPAGTEKDTRTL